MRMPVISTDEPSFDGKSFERPLAGGSTDAAEGRSRFDAIRGRLNHVLKGKPDVVDLVLVSLLARGHVLLEDKPGLGKTTLAKALAAAIGGRFARIQCTPDLLPGDVTGFSMFNQRTQQFEFQHGPIFSDVLLADEINRATPRTQSAMLEAMAERQVTVDGARHSLSPTFFVIATQNPIDQHGTYPLPEAQRDRFATLVGVGYPNRCDELQMLAEAARVQRSRESETVPLLCPSQLNSLQCQVETTYVSEKVQGYLLDLVAATRCHPQISLGVSPRGSLTWQRLAQARAFLQDRDFVTPEDVQSVALPVLAVRLGIDHGNPAPLVRELLERVDVPDA